MGEESLPAVSLDRNVEQAILAMKKGAYLLKCGRRGKPKFCPFKLSTDEKYLIWYSGQEEKQLRLSLVTKIVTGQKTVNFQRLLQPDKVHQSFSLIYWNGENSLDLICKDKAQANSWFIGLRAVISRCHHSRPLTALRRCGGAQSCVSSPAGYIRRKHNLGILVEDSNELSQVRSLCGSPTQSLSERCFSDGLSFSSDTFIWSESTLPQMLNAVDDYVPNSPFVEQTIESTGSDYICSEFEKNVSHRFVTPTCVSPQIEKNDALKDVLLWGEGVEGGNIGGVVNQSSNCNGMQIDALLPKLLDSTAMLDVRNISLGGKHAAIVTKQGEVFCWGEGSAGKLGHKVNMDVTFPKVVESLEGVHVESLCCGEYQTCALAQSGELYIWGDGKYGLNVGDENMTKSHWFPQKVSGILDGISILNVSCGEWHTAVVSSSGHLFTYGDGTFGALGHGNLLSVSQPKEVGSFKGLRVKSVACGSWHTAAIVDIIVDRFKFNGVGGKLFTWGDGDKGRLGHNNMERKLLPTCVAQLVDYDFVQVSCGRMLTVALTNTGKVYTMGSSVHGQLGNPHAKDKSITIVEGKLKEEIVKEISSGSYHVAALTSTGCVYTWGKGSNGQLGLGKTDDRNTPAIVEALRDRQVEKIACGSNLTAAICLHKSISFCDQSTCSGCRMPFGFTRKKHNCYNCGLQFCRTCSSRKVINASLAPNKSKPFRVCDSCFNNTQKITCSSRISILRNHCSRKAMFGHGTLHDTNEEREALSLERGHLLSTRESYDVESQRKQQQNAETAPSLSDGFPKWGQVPCPVAFDQYNDQSPAHNMQYSKSIVPFAGNHVEVSHSIKLTEEIERLQAEVRNREMQCQIRNQKILECQEALEKAWMVAREESAKRKAASEIIKVLAFRLHSTPENVSSGREAKDGIDPNLTSNITCADNIVGLYPGFSTTLPEVNMPPERQIDSLASTPIVFSNTLKVIEGRELCHDNSRPEDRLNVLRTDSWKNGTTTLSKLEWVEQYEPGVYITFTIFPGGQKGLKRVRFSRKRFGQKEAESWWKENQVKVYQKYGIEGNNSNQNKCKH